MATTLADTTDPPEGAIPLGHDTFYTKVFREGVWVGIHEWHKHGDEYGAGMIPFTGRYPGSPVSWEVESEEPLTLSPSLACAQCGHHGWVREGVWVPA